jgi:hypothetical protein
MEETIELIKSNIRDMSTRKMLRNKTSMDVYNAGSQPLLLNYVYIIAPLYFTDPSSKTFIDKTRKIRNEQLALPAFVYLLKHKITLNDTLVKYYARNVLTRSYFYNELVNEGVSNLFPNEFLSQELLNESALKTYMKLNSYGSFEQESKDSLLLYRVLPAINKYETGKIYIYKTPKNKFGISKWSAVFVNNKDGKTPSSNMQILKLNEMFHEKLSDSEIENSILDDFSNTFRSRISATNEGVSFDY